MSKAYMEVVSREMSRLRELGIAIRWFVERGASRAQARHLLLQEGPLGPAAQRVQGEARDEAQVYGATATMSTWSHVPPSACTRALAYSLTCPPTY